MQKDTLLHIRSLLEERKGGKLDYGLVDGCLKATENKRSVEKIGLNSWIYIRDMLRDDVDKAFDALYDTKSKMLAIEEREHNRDKALGREPSSIAYIGYVNNEYPNLCKLYHKQLCELAKVSSYLKDFDSVPQCQTYLKYYYPEVADEQ